MSPLATRRTLFTVTAVAAAGCVLGAVIDPERAAASYLTAFTAALGVVLAVLLLLMIVELTGGRWFVPLRRHAEAIISTLPLLALLFVPIVLAAHVLYPWAGDAATLDARTREAVRSVQPYLTTWFGLLRVVLYWTVWIVIGRAVVRLSRARDRAPDSATTERMKRLCIVGVPAVALTFVFASIDLIMSRAPAWSSSVFSVYVFAGGMVGAIALLATLHATTMLRRTDPVTSTNTLAAAGKLLLAFILFWAYLGYAQLLIIWIANVPREVVWYALRTQRGWSIVAVSLLAGHFAVPFLLLLARAVKRNPRTMIGIGCWLLAAHYLDAYWLIMPAAGSGAFAPHWMDIASLLFVIGSTGSFAALAPGKS